METAYEDRLHLARFSRQIIRVRLAFELLAEGVPVWLDTWELGPGDPLIASLDSGLDGSARVLVVMSSHAATTKWVKYEVQKTLEAEKRLGRRLLLPVKIDDSAGLDELQGRVHINLTEDAFMDGSMRSSIARGHSGFRRIWPVAACSPLSFIGQSNSTRLSANACFHGGSPMDWRGPTSHQTQCTAAAIPFRSLHSS